MGFVLQAKRKAIIKCT